MPPMHPPRKGDLPRAELEKLAQKALEDHKGAEVHFKFTCQYCGERCTLDEPNRLYENGICFACEKETPIHFGGFSLHLNFEGGKRSKL